jgi:hypothetical protein
MPIRKDLRHLYTGPEWAAIRARILERAKNRCEHCRKPMHTVIFTYTWKTREDFGKPWRYHMVWASSNSSSWRNELGRKCSIRNAKGLPRKVWVVLAVAHLDGDSRNSSDANLKALCCWCHLRADRNQHRETRSARKDRSRPLLKEI